MNRRSFLLSCAVSTLALFAGCKSSDSSGSGSSGTAESGAAAAPHQCACPEGSCACPDCKGGNTAGCTCAPPK